MIAPVNTGNAHALAMLPQLGGREVFIVIILTMVQNTVSVNHLSWQQSIWHHTLPVTANIGMWLAHFLILFTCQIMNNFMTYFVLCFYFCTILFFVFIFAPFSLFRKHGPSSSLLCSQLSIFISQQHALRDVKLQNLDNKQ